MRTYQRLMLAVLTVLPLAACGMTDPNPSLPRTMPDGRVFYPPPGGWPSYDRGGESGGGGGGRD